MAIADGENRIQYVVTTATSLFEFPYKYWDESELYVAVVDNSTGIATDLDRVSGDYTVAATNGNPDLGAEISTTTSYDDHTITIERILPYSSDADFEIGDGIPPDALNNSLDKATAQIQQLNDSVSRSIQGNSTDPDGLNYELPTVELRKNKVVGLDDDGNVIAVDVGSGGGIVGVDTSKGLEVTGGIASCKVDDSTVGFEGSGKIEVKDAGIGTDQIADNAITSQKIQKLSDYTVIGNTTGATANPVEVAILDEDDMASNSATSLATQQSIKAYVDNNPFLNYALLSYEEATTVDGEAISTGQNVVPLNTESVNDITGSSLNATTHTIEDLPAGTYRILGRAEIVGTNGGNYRLSVYDGSTTLAYGNSNNHGSDEDRFEAVIQDAFTIASTSDITIRLYSNVNVVYGESVDDGLAEKYGVVELWKLS